MAKQTGEMTAFTGFTRQGLDFLDGLAAHNDKTWFDANRSGFDEGLMEPGKAFIVALGDVLNARVGPGIHAEPRVNGSIFRINRDTRFSADKTPYKTHFDMFLWQGEGRSRECPGYYLRITPETVHLGAGMHGFPKPMLVAYRDAVVNPKRGPRLVEITSELEKRKGVSLPEPHYARLPRGYEAAGEQAVLLRMSGMHAGGAFKLPKALGSAKFVGWCADRLEPFAPLQRWLVEALRP
jgi:uncharacterized protein (TIGR02453 family)